MKVNIICNHLMAFNALDQFAGNGFVSAIAHSTDHPEFNMNMQQFAARHRLHPAFLSPQSFQQQLKEWLHANPCDVVFVLGCPHKIPGEILEIPQFGFVNFHPAPLPQYRGPEPVFWLLKNQEKAGGLTAHIMTEEMDRGDIVEFIEIPIEKTDTHSLYTAKYVSLFPEMFRRITNTLTQNRKFTHSPQDESNAEYYNRAEYQDLLINFNQHTPEDIESLTAACNSTYGGAYSLFRNMPIRINQATRYDKPVADIIKPGTVLATKELEGLVVKCKSGAITLDIITLAEGIFSGNRFAKLVKLEKNQQFH